MLVVSDLRIPLESDRKEAIDSAVRRLKTAKGDVKSACIVKTSVDARHKKHIMLVCSVGIELYSDEEAAAARLNDPHVAVKRQAPIQFRTGSDPLNCRPVVIGFGPAGMFTGLFLARYGYRPLIVERGNDVDTRVTDVCRFWETGALLENSNVQFGEGGAGTFSDGKLTTRINDPRCDTVLEEFIRFGAPDEIRKVAKPHIGTDRLRNIVKNLRREILRCGGEIRFSTKLTGIGIKDGKISSVALSDGSEMKTEVLILAIGHSARDTFELLGRSGIFMTSKPFSVGVRIEHLQSEIEKGLYGEFAGHPSLPRGEYQLSLRKGGKAVYTFCMCPGGTVVGAASENGGVVTNGMSEYSRNGKNANSALVVSVDEADFGGGCLGGVEFQRKLEYAAFKTAGENYRAPYQTVGAFLGNGKTAVKSRVEPTYRPGVTECGFLSVLPAQTADMLKEGLRCFNARLPGFADPGAALTGVETRTSSPVRILRGETLEAVGNKGVYPAGEGAGYAGGIVSAAVDGLRVAEAVIRRYKPFD